MKRLPIMFCMLALVIGSAVAGCDRPTNPTADDAEREVSLLEKSIKQRETPSLGNAEYAIKPS